MNDKSNMAAAFVLGGAWNALGQIRALGQAGIPVYYLESAGRRDFVKASRFCRVVQTPPVEQDPDGAVACVIQLAQSLPLRPVLFHTEDVWMFAIGEREETVRRCCVLPQSPWNMIRPILNKRTLYEAARSLDVPVPFTCSYDSVSALLDQATRAPMPCVVKPEVTVGYLEKMPAELRKSMGHRTRYFNTAEELGSWCRRLASSGFDVPVLLQEFIPGGPEGLYTLTSYSDIRGRMVVGSVGHKVRQYPPDAGCIVVGRLIHEPKVYEQGQRLLDGLGFHGLANTEFKYDPRDGCYKLMEINPRLGKWNSSALAAGLNLPLAAYDDMRGKVYAGPACSTKADGAIWLQVWDDVLNCTRFYRRRGYPEHHLSFQRWMKSVKGRRIHAVWSWNDPLPGLVMSAENVRGMAAGFWHKIRLRNGGA